MKKQLFISVLMGLLATSAMAQATFDEKVARKIPTNEIVNCWGFSYFLDSTENSEVKKMGIELREMYQPVALAKFGSETAFEDYLKKNRDALKNQGKRFQTMQASQLMDFYAACLLKISNATLSVK